MDSQTETPTTWGRCQMTCSFSSFPGSSHHDIIHLCSNSSGTLLLGVFAPASLAGTKWTHREFSHLLADPGTPSSFPVRSILTPITSQPLFLSGHLTLLLLFSITNPLRFTLLVSRGISAPQRPGTLFPFPKRIKGLELGLAHSRCSQTPVQESIQSAEVLVQTSPAVMPGKNASMAVSETVWPTTPQHQDAGSSQACRRNMTFGAKYSALGVPGAPDTCLTSPLNTPSASSRVYSQEAAPGF